VLLGLLSQFSLLFVGRRCALPPHHHGVGFRYCFETVVLQNLVFGRVVYMYLTVVVVMMENEER
jgi:hypothetical protein